MAKKVIGIIKLQVPAGKANPSPPIGPALGQRGLNIMEFCKAFNAQTQKMEPGLPVPVVITAYQDKSFSFVMKTPPASVLIRKAAKIEKGSGRPNSDKVGRITRAQAEEIAEELTRGLPEASGKEPELPPVDPLAQAATRTVPHPAAQAHIVIGSPGVARADPDYIALYVGNFVLGGGGFVSRITEEVRQKRGLAYSASSYFYPLLRKGPFVISMQTRSDQAGEALKVARATLAAFMKNGPTAEELEGAKRNIVDGFPLRIDSNRKILGYLSVIGFYDLPLTYLDDFTHNIDKVTIAQIRDAFKRHIDPQAMATVIVGAPEESAK